MRQKATAARPPANPPTLAVVAKSPAGGPLTVQSLGQQLRDLLPPRRLHSVSLCDHEANVLWLSEGALGPDEHSVLLQAIGTLAADHSLPCHETPLEDGRHALSLAVRAPSGDLVGIAMILADSRSVGDDTQERVTAAPVRAIMQRLAVLMKPGGATKSDAAPAADLPPLLLELVAETDAAPAPRGAPHAAAPQPEPQTARAAESADISPEDVNDILEFELAPEDSPLQFARPNGSAPSAPFETSSEMVSLEFLPDGEPSPPAEPPVLQPRVVPPPAAVARAAAPTPPPAPAPAAAQAAAATRRAQDSSARAAPAALASPMNDARLILEVLPFAKLRAGGQKRRFQILARTSVAQRDPAALDALILQRLLGWLAAHRTVWNSQPTSFTVNLSIATLEDERFAQRLGAALNDHGIAAETLGFEIAEALCTQRRAQVERFINQCDKLGSWVAIDDFSFDAQVLPLLRSKAVRLVKINPKLSSSALKDKLSQALVVATVQAARVMGVHCAAKKVDSQAALQWLTAIGFDFAQGAALAPAQTLDALTNSTDPTITSAALRPT